MASQDQEYSFEGVEIPQANTSSDGDGGISCSIEETNRIRILLGLKPLQVGKDDPVVNREREAVDRLKKLREEQATKHNAEKLKQQIEDAQTKRLAQPKFMEKTLGDALDDEEDDTAAWVRKSREKQKAKLEEKAKQEDKRRTKLLIEQDDEDEDDADSRRAAAKARYNKSSLRGMKIGHDVNALAANEGVVLTLADTSVLANGDLNDEDDVLENVNMTELEKHQDAVKKSKMKAYNPYDDEEGNGGPSKGILSHYDDEQKKKFTLIGDDGSVESKEKKMANIRARLQASMNTQTNDIKPLALSDQPQEKLPNVEEFRQTAKKADEKKKKLRKKRMTTEEIHESVLKSIEENAAADEENPNDLLAVSMEFDSLDKATKQKKLIQRTKKVTNSILAEDEEGEEEGEDDVLSASLARARRLAVLSEKKTTKPEDAVLSTLRATSKAQMNVSQDNQKDTGVIFTATQEYIRKVGFENHDAAEESDQDEDENMKSTTSRRDQSRTTDENGAANGAGSDNENEDMQEGSSESDSGSDAGQDRQDDMNLPMEEPDLNKGGLAAALALARQRGDLSKQLYGGRTKDKIDESYGPSSTGKKEIRLEQRDEFGRILTPKEAFRALSYKFHGRRPGKRAQEKRMRKLEDQMKLEKIANDGTKSVTMELLKVQQEKGQVPYMVVSVGNKTVLGSMPGKDDDGHHGDAAIPLEKTTKMSFSMKRKEGGSSGSSKKSK